MGGRVEEDIREVWGIGRTWPSVTSLKMEGVTQELNVAVSENGKKDPQPICSEEECWTSASNYKELHSTINPNPENSISTKASLYPSWYRSAQSEVILVCSSVGGEISRLLTERE